MSRGQAWLCPGRGCRILVADDNLCQDCVDFLPVMLDDIGPLWRAARNLLTGPAPTQTERVSVSVVGSTAPMNLGLLELLDSTAACLKTWARSVAQIRGEPYPADAELVDDRAYLIMFSGELRNTSLMTDLFNHVFKYRQRLMQVAGDNRPAQRLHEPCPTCGYVTLVLTAGADHIACLNCGAAIGHSAYRRLTVDRNQIQK